MSKFFTDQKIGRTRELTPEKFLLCRDVAIARCGELLYVEGELPGLDYKAGLLRVQREPEDIFTEQSIASFAGKPVIVTHQGGEVTPENWKELAVGTVLNPRRGEGARSDELLADLLISDAGAIELVMRTTRHEVSAGYEAEYEQLGPGKARQFDIIGNHVALVEQGRCGPRCAIGDHAMPAPIPRKRLSVAARRRSTADAIRHAFLTKDEEALETALADVEPEPLDDNVPSHQMGTGDPGEQAHHITVNINGATGGSNDAPSLVKDEEPGMGDPAPDEDMPTWAHAIMARLDAIEAAMAGGGEEDPGEQPLGEEGDAPLDEVDPEDDDMPPTKDSSHMTMDAPALREMHRDALARAEVLAPGIKMLALDAKATVRDNYNQLCTFKRRVLARATKDEGKGELIAPVMAGRDLKAMTCDSVGMAFMAASELVKAHNRTKGAVTFINRTQGGGAPKMPPSPAEINAINRKAHGYA
jgi:uncharacterized protein